MKTQKTRKAGIVLVTGLLALLLSFTGFLAGGRYSQSASAQTPSAFAPPEDKLNMSQSWTNDSYFDFTTMKQNVNLGRDTKLVTTQTFGSGYTVRFTMVVDDEDWTGAPPWTMFRINLNATDTAAADSEDDEISFLEHNINGGGNLTIDYTGYGGTRNLFQQTHKDGSGFGTYYETFYQFVLDVDGDTLDLYIERKGDAVTEPRYTITTTTGFDGHLAFYSSNSTYEFRIGGVTVDYKDGQDNPAQFRGLFNVDGSISGNFSDPDCLWHTNLPGFNTLSTDSYYVGPNKQIVSNFAMDATKSVLEFEVNNISTTIGDHNNKSDGIYIVAGITDSNPAGFPLIGLFYYWLTIGKDVENLVSVDYFSCVTGGRAQGNSFKLRIEIEGAQFRVCIAAFDKVNGVWSNYFPPAPDWQWSFASLPGYDADDLANGKIAVRSGHHPAHNISFSAKALTIDEYADVTFIADASEVATKRVNKGSVLTDVPAVPGKTGYDGVWNYNFVNPITGDMTVNAAYTIKSYAVTFVADGTAVKTINVSHGGDVPTGEIPAVPPKTGYSQTAPYWDKIGAALQNVTGPITVTAVYTINTYTVTPPAQVNFTFASTDSATVDHGGSYSFKITPSAAYNKSPVVVKANGGAVLTPVAGVYTISNITAGVTITVDTLAINTYTVTFIVVNAATEKGDIIESTTVKALTVNHGDNVPAGEIPAVPVKTGYTQTAPYWDKNGAELENVTGNITVKAVYKLNVYTVTWKADGKVINTATVNHGGNVAEGDIPAVPAKEGYTGAWKDADLTGITDDMTVDAEYTEIKEEAKTKGGCAAVTAGGGGTMTGLGLMLAAGLLFVTLTKKKPGKATA